MGPDDAVLEAMMEWVQGAWAVCVPVKKAGVEHWGGVASGIGVGVP